MTPSPRHLDGPAGSRFVAEQMAEAASSWLAALRPDQRRKAQADAPAPGTRPAWYYVPTEQGRLPLAEMDAAQRRLAHRLVASGLSRPGYVTAATIIGLENVLDAAEGWRLDIYPGRAAPGRGRDPQMYFLGVRGDPGGRVWGWHVGGHHLALHHTVVDGRIAPGPVFFGAHPARAPLVGPGLLRPLAGEEDLGRELLHALAPEQRARAVLAPIPPYDVVQANRSTVEPGALPRHLWELFGVPLPEPLARALMAEEAHQRTALGLTDEHLAVVRYESTPKGLPGAEMRPGQRALLASLIRQYLDRLPEAVAVQAADRVAELHLDAVHFAWAGGGEPGEPHYYRVQGPRLLIECDNTQDGANHVHSVWRDPEGDFGADLLAQHYDHAHAAHAAEPPVARQVPPPAMG